MQYTTNFYNEYAEQYAELVVEREEIGIECDPIMPRFLEMVGDVSGLSVLDAGCGEGYLARILARRGASVTGIDVAANLVQIARKKEATDQITYEIADLGQPLPAYAQHFDLIVSHLVLNDVPDYQGFLCTLGSVAKPGGQLILSLNNPYSYVVRSHLTNYFDTDKAFSYRGLAERGVKVHFYHRTLEQYLDACLGAGFQLRRLADIPTPEGTFRRQYNTLIPKGYHFPFFMILSFVKA